MNPLLCQLSYAAFDYHTLVILCRKKAFVKNSQGAEECELGFSNLATQPGPATMLAGGKALVRVRGRTAAEHRIRMVEQSSRFLSWALRHSERMPRIPRICAGSGGFSRNMKRAFWGHALEKIQKGLSEYPRENAS